MGLLSFSGRVLFSAVFILSAWQKISDFGADGGGAARVLQPKVFTLSQHLDSRFGFNLLEFDLKYLVLASIFLQGLGGILFIFGSFLGAYLLLLDLIVETLILHDFYNFDLSSLEYGNEFVQFLKNLSLFGALLYFVGMKRGYSKKFRKKVKTT